MPSGRDVHVIVDVRYPDLSSLNFQSKELCNYSIKCPDSSHTYPSGWLADKICDQKTQGIKMKQKNLDNSDFDFGCKQAHMVWV